MNDYQKLLVKSAIWKRLEDVEDELATWKPERYSLDPKLAKEILIEMARNLREILKELDE